MKRKIAIVLIILIFVAGVGFMSYPLFSSAINNFASRTAAEDYKKTVALMPSEETEELLAQARKYNASLSDNLVISDPFDAEEFGKIGAEYENTLNIDDSGLMGYVDIPKINVYLPIYHGTDEHTLAMGAGHVQNTSLPVGGESTHSVISAHSAYPGETFFDYLTDMEVGDEFYIHILDRTLKYEVSKISVILPEEIGSLRIVEGEDLVTLLTCTPYSVNSHRLLVTGTRAEYDDTKYIETGASVVSADEDGIYFWGYRLSYLAAGLIVAGFVAAVAVVVLLILRRRRKKEKLLRLAEEQPSESEPFADEKPPDGDGDSA